MPEETEVEIRQVRLPGREEEADDQEYDDYQQTVRTWQTPLYRCEKGEKLATVIQEKEYAPSEVGVDVFRTFAEARDSALSFTRRKKAESAAEFDIHIAGLKRLRAADIGMDLRGRAVR
jgi:hypothetical protein